MSTELDFDNDFGFSAVDSSEMEEMQKEKEKATALYDAIKPLLKNLKKNPEKDHIFWPNRKEIVQEFERKIDEIYIR